MKISKLSISVNNRILFQNLNLEIKEIIGIFGPTGTGKTTLLNYIAGNLKNSPDYSINGHTDFPDDFKVSYAYQDFRLLENLTTEKNILLPLENLPDYETLKTKALELSETMQISALLNKKANTLSGGEKQRVSIVRALAYPSNLLLLDEPFSNQDEEKCSLIIELLKCEKRPVVIVSHNRELLSLLTDNIISL